MRPARPPSARTLAPRLRPCLPVRRLPPPLRAEPKPTPAANLLATATDELTAGNRAAALRLFEQAARAASSRDEAAAAAWGAAVVHTSFGDIEPAQARLREAADAGLDLAAALEGRSATPGVIPFRGAPQITTQLKRFAGDLARAKAAAAAAPPPMVPPSAAATSGPPPVVPADLDGIDGSVGAIAKRVAALLAALVGLGVGLYVYGLRYLEP